MPKQRNSPPLVSSATNNVRKKNAKTNAENAMSKKRAVNEAISKIKSNPDLKDAVNSMRNVKSGTDKAKAFTPKGNKVINSSADAVEFQNAKDSINKYNKKRLK